VSTDATSTTYHSWRSRQQAPPDAKGCHKGRHIKCLASIDRSLVDHCLARNALDDYVDRFWGPIAELTGHTFLFSTNRLQPTCPT
jgi:hypothetical protein